MTGWQQSKSWSDKFIPEIKSILGQYLICEASAEEDQKRNTDLVVLNMQSVRIACRVRKADYAERYGNEFTIRVSRPSGQQTELSKIIQGFGNYMMYAWADEQKLVKWTLADLSVFRLWRSEYAAKNKGEEPGKLMKNGDGSSDFRAYNWNALPEKFVIGKSW